MNESLPESPLLTRDKTLNAILDLPREFTTGDELVDFLRNFPNGPKINTEIHDDDRVNLERIFEEPIDIIYEVHDGIGKLWCVRLQNGRIVMVKKDTDQRFTREKRAIHMLEGDPYWVSPVKHGINVPDDYTVMEFVHPGIDLGHFKNMLSAKRLPLTQNCICATGFQGATALKNAHDMKLVYRDHGVDNIMVTPPIRGSAGFIRFVDLGLVTGSAFSDQYSSPGIIRGKFAYSAPEIFTGHPVSPASDVYGLGITLTKMTGEQILPFPKDPKNSRGYYEGHMAEPRKQAISRFFLSDPITVDFICDEMLAKKPNDRPTMNEVANFFAPYVLGSEYIDYVGPAIDDYA